MLIDFVVNLIAQIIISSNNLFKLIYSITVPSPTKYAPVQLIVILILFVIVFYYLIEQAIKLTIATLYAIVSYLFLYIIMMTICFICRKEDACVFYSHLKNEISLVCSNLDIPTNNNSDDFIEKGKYFIYLTYANTKNILTLLFKEMLQLIEMLLSIMYDIMNNVGPAFNILIYIILLITVFKFLLIPVIAYIQQTLWFILVLSGTYILLIIICFMINSTQTIASQNDIIGIEVIGNMLPKEIKSTLK